jgi:hypothetical protein
VDLLLIGRKIWRYKLATLPVLILTFCGAAYTIAVKEPVYEASSSYILINPPAPPTAEEIARDPALGRISSDNPYTRFPDQTVVVQLLASTVGSEPTRRALLQRGADPRYLVGRNAEFGFSNPIVEVKGVGASPQIAIHTAEVVADGLARELDRMQREEGVASRYRITTQQVEAPDGAALRASGQLRMLVGVLALGAVLLFVVISVADALTNLRMERRSRSRLTGNEPSLANGEAPDGHFGLGEDDWSELRANGPADPFLHPKATLPSNGGPTSHRTHRQEQRGSKR